MKPEKIPKFDWGRLDDCNLGHTPYEWGKYQETKKEPKIRSIVAYTIIWKNEIHISQSDLTKLK